MAKEVTEKTLGSQKCVVCRHVADQARLFILRDGRKGLVKREGLTEGVGGGQGYPPFFFDQLAKS